MPFPQVQCTVFRGNGMGREKGVKGKRGEGGGVGGKGNGSAVAVKIQQSVSFLTFCSNCCKVKCGR